VVHPSVPVSSVPELIAYVKASPGKISLASFGSGTISHVAGELFKARAGIEMVHVPYRGSAPMVSDLLGGQVNAAVDNLPSSIEYIKAGKLRVLAVMSASRSPALPHIPALSEFQPGFEASAWNGIAAPRNTPAEIVDKLNREINAGLANPKIAARIDELGATVFSGSPAELDRFVEEQTEQWQKVIRAAKIHLE
jgi:tripartite-type tricarboxylate transporter receptor subunit TctC